MRDERDDSTGTGVLIALCITEGDSCSLRVPPAHRPSALFDTLAPPLVFFLTLVRFFPLVPRTVSHVVLTTDRPVAVITLRLTHGSTSLVDLVDPMADGQWRSRARGRRGETREARCARRETRRSVAKQLKGFTMARARLIKRGSRAKLSGSLESALACSRVHSRANGRGSMENAIGSGWCRCGASLAFDPQPAVTRFNNVTCRRHHPVLTSSRYC